MRTISSTIAVALLLATAAPVTAQSSFIPDVIASTVMGMQGGGRWPPRKCLLGLYKPNPKYSARVLVRAQQAFDLYVKLARAGTADTSKAFHKLKYKPRWSVDQSTGDVTAVSDPWVMRAVTFRLLGSRLGDAKTTMWAQWEALAEDGDTLGIYDALVFSTEKGWVFFSLNLYSPPTKPKPIMKFCNDPGDIERFPEEEAKQLAEMEKERQAKQAQKESRRQASQAN